MNAIITKERASCIFFRKKFTVNTAAECVQKIERMEDVDLCYTTNPLNPCIMSEATIYGDLERYNLYLISMELQEIDEEDECEIFGNYSLRHEYL
jgi:hypothetical protein